jgi:hypothetical protein
MHRWTDGCNLCPFNGCKPHNNLSGRRSNDCCWIFQFGSVVQSLGQPRAVSLWIDLFWFTMGSVGLRGDIHHNCGWCLVEAAHWSVQQYILDVGNDSGFYHHNQCDRVRIAKRCVELWDSEGGFSVSAASCQFAYKLVWSSSFWYGRDWGLLGFMGNLQMRGRYRYF